MLDPFHIEGPALLSISGGRTSAYMLWRILESWGGVLPPDVYALFADTGKERRETYEFVAEIANRWAVPITMVQCPHDGFETPFDQLLRGEVKDKKTKLMKLRDYLPGGGLRFCTTDLKIRVMKRWMITRLLSSGFSLFGPTKKRPLAGPPARWDSIVGIRFDEPDRYAKLRQKKPERWTNVAPLYDAGVTEADVLKFWRGQPFDLQLQRHEGNCDLCHLKSDEKLITIMRQHPDWAQWWIGHEDRTGKQFRRTSRSYRALLAAALDENARGTPLLTEDQLCGTIDLGRCAVCVD